MAHVRMSRAGRKSAIAKAMHASEHDVHTVNSIAKLIGIKPSTYLRDLLGELVGYGFLACEEWIDEYGNVSKRWYAIAERLPTQMTLNEALYELVGE